MRKYAYRQATLNLALYAFVACMTTQPSVLLEHTAFHLVVFLVLAGLLLFVAGRSEDICRAAVASLGLLPVGFFSLNVDPVFIHYGCENIVLPKAPRPFPRFQRPPPASLSNSCS